MDFAKKLTRKIKIPMSAEAQKKWHAKSQSRKGFAKDILNYYRVLVGEDTDK